MIALECLMEADTKGIQWLVDDYIMQGGSSQAAMSYLIRANELQGKFQNATHLIAIVKQRGEKEVIAKVIYLAQQDLL